MHSISLQSSDSSIAVNDILGRIGFAASNETGSDALKVSALIMAVAEGTFDPNNNPTSLVFSTGKSETANEKMRITSNGHFLPFTSGVQDLGSPSNPFRKIYADNITGNSSGQLDNILDLNNYDIVGTGNITIDGNVVANSGNFEQLVANSGHFEQLKVDGQTILAKDVGSVGIGTDSPATKFHIREDSTYSSENTYAIKISDGNDPETHGLLLGVDSSNDGAFIQAVDPGTSWNRDLYLQRMGGDVGIGTVLPSERLHVEGDIRADGSRPTTLSGGTAYATVKEANAGGWSFGHHAKGSSGTDRGGFGWFGADDGLTRYYVGPSYTSLDSIMLTNAGNVGLKNITPACRLTIGEDIPGVSNDGISVDMEGVNKPSFTTRRDTGNPVFSILPYTSQVYLSAGAYYNGSSWVHSSNDVHNCIFTLDPGNGVLWYAGNNSSSISNIASAETLWDTLGHWKNLWRTTKTDHNWALGSLSIGADYPVQSSKLHLKQAYNTAGGTTSTFTQYIDIDNTSTQDLTNYSIGINIDARKDVSTGKTDSGYIMAGDFNASVAGTNTGTLEGSYGIRTFAGIRDAGTVNNAYGVYSRVLNLGTGTINNGYGIYIHNVNATNSYGLYQSATDDKNYFAGNVGINTTTPATKLHIRKDSSYFSENSYAIKISDGNDPETHGMLLGVDSGNNIASIQAIDPGTSWGRNLSLQVMGGNLGVGTTTPTEKLHVYGGNIQTSAFAGDGGGIGKADDGLHILYPGGGTYGGSSSASVTGYIKIKLPTKSTSTMLAFDLDIYEYENNLQGRIAKFRIAGYEYNATNWTRTQVIMDSNGPTDNQYKVRFGVDTNGDKAIWVSYYSDGKNGIDQAESSLWRYPKVSISNLFCGHHTLNLTDWIDGWDVGIVGASDIASQAASHVVSRSLNLYENNYDLASLTINSDYTFPTSDGSANQFLKTNGAGTLSFGDPTDQLNGYVLNYASSEGWVEGNGTQIGYHGGNFSRVGAEAENFCEFGDLPNGMRGLIWKSRNNTIDSGADGGWTKNISGIDPEKTYVSIVYVRRVGNNTSGYFYHGCATGSVNTYEMNGNPAQNPYFHAFNIAQLPQDVWCVSIGIIHAHSDPTTTSTGIGGIYRLDTGVKTGTFTNRDYRMGPAASLQNHRTFLYYDATGQSALDFCWPGFYDVTSPEAASLLNTLLYNHVNNIDITDFNASSIITESEGILSNDNDTTLPTSAAVKDYVDNNGGGSGNLKRGSFAVTTSTSVFTVSGGYNTNTLDVYQNGVKLFKGSSYDFTETGGGTTFTLNNAATNGDLIEYVALNASTNAIGNTSLGSISVTSNQTVFNTSDTFTSSNLAVFLNGVKLVDGTDYNVTSSSQFTLTSTAVSGDVVEYIAYGATVASSNLSKTGDTMTGNLTVNADLIVTGYKETHTDNGNTGNSQTIDISDSTLQTYTLTGNCTFTMPTADAGRSFTMLLKTGAGSFVATFTGVKFPSNSTPTITTDANRMDIITFYSDGTNWYGSIQQEYHI